ncbi:Fumarate reductase/succinate dehydrogenase flavoprotein domain protein [Candidatus Sulfopaludibacter sp. SbA4]|nr:Fumarate reductase/succinate dehydrogenase flavoprotein domain protein [Candidatus Sulfopaludibacter sp. SbA4]
MLRETEIAIAGGGLAGIVTALELLDRGRRVLLIDKDRPEKFGGLARESFGGVHMIDTPHQRRLRIHDTPELAWRDWQSVAGFVPDDHWPREWARFYCENSREHIFEFLDGKGVHFLPLVNWAERGLHAPGNSVPRWHIAWGIGYEIVERLLAALEAHPRRANLDLLFDTEVSGIEMTGGRAVGVRCGDRRVQAEHVVIASGGICGGDLRKVRANWYQPWGEPPAKLLNGAHIYGDGMLHDRAAEMGAAVTHLDLQWHYAAGVHHPARRRPDDGLSLVPPRSALWLNAHGERILNPGPMLAYADTRHLVASVLRQPGQYSWQVMNWKIAIRELAVSGCDYMTDFRYKKRLALAWHVLFGNRNLVERLMRDCPDDIVAAATLDELMDRMDAKNLYGLRIDRARMEATVRGWDEMIARGAPYHYDDQLRRIANSRTYRGDRLRTCAFQRILDPKAGPLIAIREFILARKSLGGIQTDLGCRVLRAADGEPIPGLYAVGEAAGFGGGGIHGKGSLEGTFLGGCVLTGRIAGRSIAK